MQDDINNLIGKHPIPPDFFSEWLKCEDILIPTGSQNKKYRKITEIDDQRDKAVKQISEWLIDHLVSNSDIIMLRERKREIYNKYSYEQYLEAQLLLPTDGSVMQGNFAEIVFVEYLKSLKKYDFLVYKLLYNPNILQSMKGDDILMFDKGNLRRILLGESKYRKDTTKQTIEEILESFGGSTKIPISITFITRILFEKKPNLSKQLSEIQTEIKNGENHILNVGMILSNTDVYKSVEKHNFYADFSLTQSAIDELTKCTPGYPVDSIKCLIGQTFKNETKLREKIQEKIADKEVGTGEEKKQGAKDWTNKKHKAIIFEHSTKSINPSLLFISMGIENLDACLNESFSAAKALMNAPENLNLKSP